MGSKKLKNSNILNLDRKQPKTEMSGDDNEDISFDQFFQFAAQLVKFEWDNLSVEKARKIHSTPKTKRVSCLEELSVQRNIVIKMRDATKIGSDPEEP